MIESDVVHTGDTVRSAACPSPLRRSHGTVRAATGRYLGCLVLLVLIPLFLVWFFKVRRNAGFWGPQRRSQGWSIGAWFVPVVLPVVPVPDRR